MLDPAFLVALGGLISVTFTGIIGIIVAVKGKALAESNGRAVAEVHDAVKTSNGTTIGEIIEAQGIDKAAHDAVTRPN